MEAAIKYDTGRVAVSQASGALPPERIGALEARWDGGGRMTSLGGLAYFAEYLKEGGFLDELLRCSPLRYASNNAPDPADVMGTLVVSVLDGITRYSGINGLRRDEVCPELMGFRRMVSEDSVRRGLLQSAARPEEWEAWLRRLEDRATLPLLSEPYVADMDNTVKTLYGHQEGAERGYNPAKPGRPSHNYQTWAMGATRLVLGVGVLPGRRHSGRHGAALALDWIRRLPAHLWPSLLRGDVGFGSSGVMEEAEGLGLRYLFKLARSRRMKRLFRQLCQGGEWLDAGRGWEGLFVPLRLTGWPRVRRCLFLRRPAGTEPASENKADRQLLLPAFGEIVEPPGEGRKWDFCVLATNCADLDAVALSQLYRDRADCENVFDELKNHWGWGGFVTRDLARTRLVARLTALLYNLWTVFTRLVSPEAHREAETSRPMLLGVLGRVTKSGRKTTIHLVSNHAAGERIAAALSSVHAFMRRLNATAGQLDGLKRWTIILAAAFRHFLHGNTPHPPLDGEQWLLPLASAAY